MSNEKPRVEELAAKVDDTLNNYHESIEVGANADVTYINQLDVEARDTIRVALERISNDLDGQATLARNFCSDLVEWVNANKLVPDSEDITSYINGPRQA